MRALVGAIITAGALVCLGLTALGIGTRYAMDPGQAGGEPYLVRLTQMDRPLVFCLVFSTSVAVAGLGIAFVGLSYHPCRREREYKMERERAASLQRTSV
jgi:hypothetical protein